MNMAFLDTGIFCSAAEYERDFERRVSEADLREADIYAMVARLQSSKRAAAKLAVRLLQKTDNTLTIAFLDNDLNPVFERDSVITDGVMHRIPELNVRDIQAKTLYPVQQAFLKDYFEDQFGSMLAESESLSVPA